MSKEKPNNKSKISAFVIWIIVLIMLFGKGAKNFLNKKSYTKEQLASLYNVNRKTLSKWIQLFVPNIWEDFNKIKKITTSQYLDIIEILGEVSNETPVLTKGEIVKRCDSDVRTLRNCIVNNPSHFGVSLEAYKSVSKFPPLIAKGIIDAFGGE